MGSERPVEIQGVELLRQIGSGGFGAVWLGYQTALDRQVAVKVGHRTLTDVQDRRRFERECKALGRLSGHPNIVDVHLSGVSSGRPYLVLRYIDGGDLAEHGPGMDESRLRRVADQLCESVAAAHRIGVLHRDLKPENVFLDRAGTAVLGDFGIARIGDDNNTATGAITASVAFAAPEILSGGPPTQASDIYGIGVTIMAAILGRSPFITSEHTSPEAVIAQVFTADPPPLSPYGISPEFEALLRRTMDRDPARRPATAEALQAEIAALPVPSAELRTTTIGGPGADPRYPAGAQPPPTVPPAAPPSSAVPSSAVPSSAVPSSASVQPRPPDPPRFIPSTVPPSTVSPARSRGTTLVVAAVAVAVVAGFAGVALALRPDSQTLGSNTMDQEASRTEPGDDSDREGPQPESFESSDEDSPISAPSSGPESTEDEQEEETTTTIPAPLALPLTGAEISNLTPIPLDFDDLDELLGPADNPSFCEVRPDITGLLETVGAVYPRDPTTDVSLRQIALRMHRFATPEQADGFMESFTTITCDSWESDEYSADGITNLTASVGEPTLVVGDDIRQVDQVATLPNGVDILSRSVVVRHGVDVLKLVFLTVRADELTELTDRLVERATRNLGY